MEDLFKNFDDINDVKKIKELENRYNSLSNRDKIRVLNSLNSIISGCKDNVKREESNNSKDSFDILKDNLENEDIEERIKQLRDRFF